MNGSIKLRGVEGGDSEDVVLFGRLDKAGTVRLELVGYSEVELSREDAVRLAQWLIEVTPASRADGF